jgi:LmbE family N-acetylglucosaminyl deacetylase
MPVPPGFDRIGPPIHPKRVFNYYCSHLKSVPAPSFIVDTTGHAEQKLAAIECYATQFSMNPINASYPQTVRAIDVYFGSRIGAAAGEPFWVREPLGLESLTSISGVANP